MNTNMVIPLTLIIALLVFVVSAGLVLQNVWSGLIFPDTQRVTETRNLPPSIVSVELNTPAEISFTQSSSQTLTLSGSQARIDTIEIIETGDKLMISNKQRMVFQPWQLNRLEVKISLMSLEGVTVSGAGSVVIKNLTTSKGLNLSLIGAGSAELKDVQVKELVIATNGAGNVNARGTAERCNYSISGAGSVRANEFTCENAQAEVSGAGSIEVFAEKSLYARVSGVGSIEYSGNATVDQSVNGLGSIRKK